MSQPRRAYFVMPGETDENGDLIPCIATEGESGYHRTDWRWGKDFKQANQWAEERNTAMGISPKEAFMIVLSTMPRGG